MGDEGDRQADSLFTAIAAASSPRDADAPRVTPAKALADRVNLEALRRELRSLLALVAPDEAVRWRERLESLRGLRGEALAQGLGVLRVEVDRRSLELERAKAGPADAGCVMILDKCGHVIAARGDPALPEYFGLVQSLRQAMPRLTHGPHLMSGQAGRVGLVVGEHGAVAASFRGRTSGPGMEVLAHILTALEKRHAGALAVRGPEDRALVDGYAEATAQLLAKAR
jgi:hypothetical protein